MSNNRFSHPDNQAGSTTLVGPPPSTNGHSASAAPPARDGRNGDALHSQPHTAKVSGKKATGSSTNGLSANGCHGDQAGAREIPRDPAPHPRPLSPEGRGENGRFAKGNPGGPGNPFAREVAALRQALLKAVTPEDIHEIAVAMKEAAKAGNVQAAKVVLSYTLGKPEPMPRPDDLDWEEWQKYQREAGSLKELPRVVAQPALTMPLDAVRVARDSVTHDLGDQLAGYLSMPPGKQWDRLDEMAPAKAAAELRKLAKETIGKTKPGPSANGKKRR